MSFIVGLNLEQYALLGADTRVSYYPGNRLVYRDDETKIRTTSVGLITGAGLCDLLDPVKDRMAVEEPPHTDAIRQVIREECREAQRRFANCPDQRVQESLQTTGWMMTYLTDTEQYFPAGLRVAIMGSADENNRFQLAPPGIPAYLPFSGITQEQYDELLKMLKDELRPWKQADESLSDNVVHHVGIIARVIKRALGLSRLQGGPPARRRRRHDLSHTARAGSTPSASGPGRARGPLRHTGAAAGVAGGSATVASIRQA